MSASARLAEWLGLWKARIALALGERDRAREALRGVLSRNPNSFPAHFQLGRLYLLDDSPVKARREFDLAWQIDPERFEGAYARLRNGMPGAPDLFGAGEPADGRPVSIRAGGRREERDYRSEDERQRFAAMPPISREEIREIDWERLEQEISRGQ